MTETAAPLRRVRTMCPMNCHPTFCGLVVEVEDGRVAAVHGDPDNPDSRGFLCPRGRASAEIVDNPRRLLHPRVRDGRDAPWRDAGWPEALDAIAASVMRVGPGATAVWAGHGVFVSGAGGQLVNRFAAMTGMQTWSAATVCWGLGGLGFSLTGVSEVSTATDLEANADLIVLWGANLASQPTTARHIVAARARGAHVVAIDVRRTEAFAQADETFVVRPGTDASLALGLMHVIVTEGLVDRAFVADHTVGYEELAAHVLAFTPEWAEAETGIPAARIRDLARRYASTRRAQILAGGSSMHKSGNGWHAARAIACLPALTGSLGVAGGGMGPRHAAQPHGMRLGSIVPPRALDAAPLVPSDMSTVIDWIESGRIRALLLLGTNMRSSFADSERLRAALARLELVVSYDLFDQETARDHADVVLPGTAWLEETGYKLTNRHVHLMDRVLEPRGEARPVGWVLDELAGRLGVTGYLPGDPDELDRPSGPPAPGGPTGIERLIDAILDADATRHTTVARLRAEGPSLALDVAPVAHADLRFATPSGRVELASARAESLGLPRLPVPAPAAESHRGAPQGADFPLVLTQGRTLTHFHGFYDHGRALPSLARLEPGPRLWVNPRDAAPREITNGDAIRVWNARGEMDAQAEVTDRVPAGVVWIHDGWEGLNRLTSGARTVSDAVVAEFPTAGASAYEARVEISLRGAMPGEP